MLAQSSVRLSSRFASSSSQGVPGVDGVAQGLYKSLWRKSNIMYITYIVVGCVVIEGVYGGVTTSIWESSNRGAFRFAFTERSNAYFPYVFCLHINNACIHVLYTHIYLQYILTHTTRTHIHSHACE